jgi:hypothetical protein
VLLYKISKTASHNFLHYCSTCDNVPHLLRSKKFTLGTHNANICTKKILFYAILWHEKSRTFDIYSFQFTFIIFISTQNCFDRLAVRERERAECHADKIARERKFFIAHSRVLAMQFLSTDGSAFAISWGVVKAQKKFLTITCGFCNAYNDNKLCCYEACSAFFSWDHFDLYHLESQRSLVEQFIIFLSSPQRGGWQLCYWRGSELTAWTH